MELGAAFLLGLIGSLHCAGMCGPLALALPQSGGTRLNFGAGRMLYNLGRITAYSLLGVVFGLVGQTAAFAGVQRWVSLLAGVVVLLASRPVLGYRFGSPTTKAIALLKSEWGRFLRRRTQGALYLLGVLNGFLPCGLVYVACVASVALGSLFSAVGYMLAFGLGTLPLMLGIGLIGRNVQLALRVRFQKLIPLSLLLVGTLLILRGMALGIPYLSPNLVADHCCH